MHARCDLVSLPVAHDINIEIKNIKKYSSINDYILLIMSQNFCLSRTGRHNPDRNSDAVGHYYVLFQYRPEYLIYIISCYINQILHTTFFIPHIQLINPITTNNILS